jgi:4'-phosphopantetheinyl transferase EntD
LAVAASSRTKFVWSTTESRSTKKKMPSSKGCRKEDDATSWLAGVAHGRHWPGVHDFPLLPGPDRAPVWPGAVVGSITHTEVGTHGYCGVAVAHRRLVAGLGIDAEPRLPLPVELWSRVLDPDEGRAALAAEQPGVQARLVFSAKEAAYKAIYPLYRRFLDFSDLHIRFLATPGCFLAELASSAPLATCGFPLLGRFVMDQELLLTAVLLPPSGSPVAQEWLFPSLVPC